MVQEVNDSEINKSFGVGLAEAIVQNDLDREKVYPLPSVLEKIEREMGMSVQNLIAEKALGRIFDKLELAEKFIELIPLYYDESGNFWIWDLKDLFWRQIDEVDLLSWIDKNAEVNVISSKDKTEILNAFRLTARRNKPKDPEKNFIQFKKEIVDLKTGDRFIARHERFMTNPIPHRLGAFPNVDKFEKLFSSWVKKEDVENLYEILAFCMVCDYPIERLFCLHGSGSNGKSCFLQILTNLIGKKNICSTSLDTLTKSRFEAARLYKKLVCVMGETNLSKIDNTQLIKRLVSGKDLVPMEQKNKTPFETIPYAKIVMATNNLPPTDDKTDGFYRKWIIIDFPHQFEDDKDILSDLTEEDYENLCCKCLEVLDRLLVRRKFANEGTIEQRRERYEAKSNPFDRFLREFVDDTNPESDITKWEFERRLTEWLKENRLRAISTVSLSKLMKHHGISEGRVYKDWFEGDVPVRRQVRCWLGVKWREL